MTGPRQPAGVDRNPAVADKGVEMFYMPDSRRLATALAGAAIASAMMVSGASADEGYVDLRSPDAVDAARAAGDPPAEEGYTDLRMPDRREQTSPSAPGPQAASVDDPSQPTSFDWVSAALGAAAGTGLLLLVLAAAGLARRRPAVGA
jgi:hypothetical protein